MGRPDPNGCERCGRVECQREAAEEADNLAHEDWSSWKARPGWTGPNGEEWGGAAWREMCDRIGVAHEARNKARRECRRVALDWRALYFAERARADAAESALARATVRPGEGQPDDLSRRP